ncbi:class I SAM-dependent methyltransferase [Bacteroidota bacterium]
MSRVFNFIIIVIRTFIKWRKYKPLSKYPFGHFYSPIVSKGELIELEDHIWEEVGQDFILGINLNLDNQLLLLKEFSKFYPEMPFKDEKSENQRYCFINGAYSYTDAIILYSFIRHFKPKQIIEIGSGHSSAVMLDTRETFVNDINLTFIEPYPKRLYRLFKDNDRDNCNVLAKKVQNVPINEFQKLQRNDILFIDSSHVSKTGSDVNCEIFKILPILNSGVIIHFHDVFYPFEYPKSWVSEGRNWNEDYLLRAFLSYNNQFEIVLFSHFIHQHHKAAFKEMPLTYKNTGGNLWIRKI